MRVLAPFQFPGTMGILHYVFALAREKRLYGSCRGTAAASPRTEFFCDRNTSMVNPVRLAPVYLNLARVQGDLLASHLHGEITLAGNLMR